MRTVFDTDTRSILGSVQAPTLVVYRMGLPGSARSRYIAEHIPGAQRVEVEGRDLLAFVDSEQILDAIEAFLTGQVAHTVPDRVLATVLFTDLVSSTPQLAEMGDRRWRNLIATHDALVRSELDRFVDGKSGRRRRSARHFRRARTCDPLRVRDPRLARRARP